ncbi:MAG TPA: protein-methionine-sulfoxide reductase catalytic subunit MsrP [Magnetospirillaceae bacterium]|jgi:sulfoxide reductase catalytic subunit YedY
MLIRRAPDIRPSEITPESIYLGRRAFMAGTGALLAGSAIPGIAFADVEPQALPKVIKSKYTVDEKVNSYKEITTYNNFYEYGTDKGEPAVNAPGLLKPSPWTVTVDGECNKPGTVDVDDFIKTSALEERVYRHRCVEAWSMVIPWVGVPLADVIKRFEPNGNAKYVAFQTLDDPKQMPGEKSDLVYPWPYTEGLRMDEAMNALTLLSVGLYGKTLAAQNGAPIRLVVPWKYGFKDIKSIVRISFVRNQPKTMWNQIAADEYGFYANVNPNHDHPRWSQAKERRIGEFLRRPTLMFNGYTEQVASLYSGMNLDTWY